MSIFPSFCFFTAGFASSLAGAAFLGLSPGFETFAIKTPFLHATGGQLLQIGLKLLPDIHQKAPILIGAANVGKSGKTAYPLKGKEDILQLSIRSAKSPLKGGFRGFLG
jgi:hypothetical protein